MIRNVLRLLPGIALGALLLQACAEPARDVAGGSAVEGETVTARLLDAQGAPIARTTVRATVDTPSTWTLVVSSDDSGRFALEVPPTAEILFLALESPDLPGHFLTFRIPLRRGLDTSIVLERWGRLSGTVLPPSGWSPRAVLVPGLDLRATVSDGAFSFAHVRPGDWPLRLSADSAGTSDTFDLGWARMPAGGTDVHQTFSVRERALFAAAFDDSASRRLAVCSGGTAAAGGSASCVGTATGSSAWSGASLRLHLAGAPGSVASVRLAVGSDPQSPLATGSLDTLALMARGTGLVSLVLGVASGDSTIVSAPHGILLQPTWAGFRTPLSTLLPEGSDLAGVRWIAILSEEDSWIVLDELRILPRVR
jgi:hypothetical protein